MEAPYPFLCTGAADLAHLMAEVRESTLAKIREIAELRKVAAAPEATRLANCAEAMAARLAAGGRLFASATPGSGRRATSARRSTDTNWCRRTWTPTSGQSLPS